MQAAVPGGVVHDPLLLAPAVRGLIDKLRARDPHQHRALSRKDLSSVASSAGLSLSLADLERLFQRFDKRCTGLVDSAELIEAFRRAEAKPSNKRGAHGLLLSESCSPP